MSITSTQAVSLLENVLFETPATAQANAALWVSGAGIAASATAMVATSEAGIAEQVVRFYYGGLGRAPGGAEIAYYVTIAETGLTPAQISQGAAAVSQATWNQIAADFTNSPEFAASNPAGSVVESLYLNILGRAPSASETSYYNAQLNNGAPTSLLLQEFVNSPEYTKAVNGGIATALATYGTAVAQGQPITFPGAGSIPVVASVSEVGLSGVHHVGSLSHGFGMEHP